MSPLLFCLAEDVLSRGINLLVESGLLQPMVGSRFSAFPSHCMYVDDIFVFCKGSKRNLRTHMQLLNEYANNSGQHLSLDKCKFYPGSMSSRRIAETFRLFSFGAGKLPFTYLGVPLFQGKPKVCHLQQIADRIKLKLGHWKGSTLSIMGRVMLVKSIIHGMLLYSFQIYSWPISLLKTLDRWIEILYGRGTF